MFKVRHMQQDMPLTKNKQLTKAKCVSVMVHSLSWFIWKISTFIIHHVSIGYGWDQVPQSWHQTTLFHLFYIYSPSMHIISLSGNHTDKTYRTEEDVVRWQTQKLFSSLVLLLSFVCSCMFLFLFWPGCNPDCCNWSESVQHQNIYNPTLWLFKSLASFFFGALHSLDCAASRQKSDCFWFRPTFSQHLCKICVCQNSQGGIFLFAACFWTPSSCRVVCD